MHNFELLEVRLQGHQEADAFWLVSHIFSAMARVSTVLHSQSRTGETNVDEAEPAAGAGKSCPVEETRTEVGEFCT